MIPFQEQKSNLRNFSLQGLIEYEWNETEITKIIVSFREMHFPNIIRFIREQVDKKIKITINDNIELDSKTFIETLDLSNCEFNGVLKLTNCIFKEEVYFRGCTFNELLNLNNSTFESKTRFHFSSFKKESSFQNTSFCDLVDFYHTNFEFTQSFWLTDFLDITIFSNATFHKQVQFLYNKISNKTFISFENAEFKESLDISRANFWCRLQVWGIIVNIIPNEYWLYETDKIQERTDLNLSETSLKRIRESYRRIKQEFRNNNNNIEALRFQEYEMITYKNELESLKTNEKSLEDRIILTFNELSNKFGTSWSRGLGFTVITTLIFYLLFLWTIQDGIYFKPTWEGLGDFIKYFLQFLNIAFWNFKPFGIDNYIWGYVILFIGRIFIGYGYYQTIQAFRKYGKN